MEKINKKNAVAALSVYSSRVSACVAVLGEDGLANVIGLGKSEGKFMGSTGILDIDALSGALRDSLKIAQEESGTDLSRVLVGVTGGSIGSEKSRGMVRLSHKSEEITQRRIREVMKVADVIPAGIEKSVIHSIPQHFTVDGQGGIKNPTGLYGVKLEAETLLITAPVPFLQNTVKCLNMAGLDAEDIVFSGIAASRCLLSGQGGEGGVVLMEIDNNFTVLSIFFDGTLIAVDVYGKSVISDGAIEVLKKKIDKIRGGRPVSRVILAGGSYVHEDFIEKMEAVFGVPSQAAYARNIRGSAKDINNPANITSIGLAVYGLMRKKENMARRKGGGLLGEATRKVGDFLSEYF